jgi:peptidoglycan/LPS O-acetylase OafA/YrhL
MDPQQQQQRHPQSGHRYLEVDLLKCAGIAAIVVIHSLRDFWQPDFSTSDLWIGQLMRFGVPAFLAVSGFLYAGTAIAARTQPEPTSSWNSVGSRLVRILVPYLVASAIATALGVWSGALNEPPAYLTDFAVSGAGAEPSRFHQLVIIAVNLLLGNTFGPYYYVFVICMMIAFTPLLLLFVLGVQILFESGVLHWYDFFWYVRNPGLWGAYFLTGWWVRVRYSEVKPFVALYRRALMVGGSALLAACGFILAFESRGIFSHEVAQLTAWLGVYAVLGLLFVSGCGRETRSAWLRGVSDLTYTVYLFHLFLLYPLRSWLEFPAGPFDPLLVFVTAGATLSTTLLLAWSMRRLLGTRARFWLGA